MNLRQKMKRPDREHQTRWGSEDKSEIFFFSYFSTKTYLVTFMRNEGLILIQLNEVHVQKTAVVVTLVLAQKRGGWLFFTWTGLVLFVRSHIYLIILE